MVESDPQSADLINNEQLDQVWDRLAESTKRTPEFNYVEFMNFHSPVSKGTEEHTEVDFWVTQKEKDQKESAGCYEKERSASKGETVAAADVKRRKHIPPVPT